MSATNDLMSGQSWEYTRGYAGVFGQPPAPFVTAVRHLLNLLDQRPSDIPHGVMYDLVRMMKSPSLFAPFYFAAFVFEPSMIPSNSRLSQATVLRVFSPFEIASMLAAIYLWRRSRALCDAEEMSFLEESMVESCNLGFLVGRAIPAIGAGISLLQAATPILGLAAFLRHDTKGFKEYRRLVKKQGARWDSELEMQRWGCTRIQVGSVLAQSLGFGVKRANAIASALSGFTESGSQDEIEIARDVQMADLWCESIRSTGKAPEVALSAKYYPTHAALQNALKTLAELQTDRAQAAWIEKGKDDLPRHQIDDVTSQSGSPKPRDEFEVL
jgi:hypothetical protein